MVTSLEREHYFDPLLKVADRFHCLAGGIPEVFRESRGPEEPVVGPNQTNAGRRIRNRLGRYLCDHEQEGKQVPSVLRAELRRCFGNPSPDIALGLDLRLGKREPGCRAQIRHFMNCAPDLLARIVSPRRIRGEQSKLTYRLSIQ